MSARTEAAGAGMSVGDSLQVVKVAIGLLRSDGYVVMPDKLEAALATLQARLLAADELREAAYMVIPTIENSGATALLQHALAAYDKAGGQ